MSLSRGEFLKVAGIGFGALMLRKPIEQFGLETFGGLYDVPHFGKVAVAWQPSLIADSVQGYVQAYTGQDVRPDIENTLNRVVLTFAPDEFLAQLKQNGATDDEIKHSSTLLEHYLGLTIWDYQGCFVIVNLAKIASYYESWTVFEQGVRQVLAAELGHLVAFAMGPEDKIAQRRRGLGSQILIDLASGVVAGAGGAYVITKLINRLPPESSSKLDEQPKQERSKLYRVCADSSMIISLLLTTAGLLGTLNGVYMTPGSKYFYDKTDASDFALFDPQKTTSFFSMMQEQ